MGYRDRLAAGDAPFILVRTTAVGGSGKEDDDEAAVVEVGPLSGAMSPLESWIRNPVSTPNCDGRRM